MHEGVCVLLVSVGESSGALGDELAKLDVAVVSGSLADAEELIESDGPDLVVLLGARGAMELATLLDDQEEETRPKMVVAAQRRDLAKLRGLNREIVVSLFALETTEKVVAQRVESLARRAARKNGKLEPVLEKKTSLGLPSTAAVAKVALKKAPPKPLIREESVRGVENGSPNPPRVAEAPVPPKISPESVEVSDEDLMSLRPSEAPEEGIEMTSIPPSGALPDLGGSSVPAPVSVPPTLPPEAREDEKPVGGQAEGDTDELDTSHAEAALENLDSAKVEITQELIDAAQKSLSEAPEAHETIESILPDADEPSEVQVDETERAVDSGSAGGADASDAARASAERLETDSNDQQADEDSASESTDGAGSEEEHGGQSEGATPVEPQVGMGTAEVDIREKPSEPSGPIGDPLVVESMLSPPPGLEKKSGGSLKWFAAALLLLGLGGGYLSGSFGSGGASRGTSSEEREDTTHSAPEDGAHAETNGTAEPAPAKEEVAAAPSAPSDAPPNAEPVEAAEPSEEPSPQSADPSSALVENLDNPFHIPDSKAPTCAAVLGSSKPEAGKDPVHEASLIWAAARKLIVGGKLDEAHRKMCEAVSLNPESAAIEGLAQHYLAKYAPSEALRWIEKADKIRPNQTEMGFMRGDALSLMGQSEKALTVWLETLHIKSDESHRMKASSKDYSVEAGRHLRRGDLGRAERFFRRAITLDPENLGGVIGLAKVFHRAGRKAHARAFALISLKVSDVIPEVHVLLGDMAFEAGDQGEARSRYERALAVRPGFFPAKRGLGQLK